MKARKTARSVVRSLTIRACRITCGMKDARRHHTGGRPMTGGLTNNGPPRGQTRLGVTDRPARRLQPRAARAPRSLGYPGFLCTAPEDLGRDRRRCG